MRRAALLLPLLLTACHQESDFDDRYDKAAKEVEARYASGTAGKAARRSDRTKSSRRR